MTSGGNKKDLPRGVGDARDTTPVDPVEMEGEMSGLDDGWGDPGLDDLLGPDEGPTVVDGSLEMAAVEMASEPAREPSRTFLGMGPQAQVAPVSEEEITGEEVTEVGVPALPEANAPGTLDGLASQAAPEPAPAQSPLASLASQDVAYKDTLLPSDTGAPAMAPEPVDPEAEAPASRPTPLPPVEGEPLRVTQEQVSHEAEPKKRRPVAETEPTNPVVRRRTGQGEDGEVAMAATMAPGEVDAMAMAPTMAPDPDSAVLRVPPPAPEPELPKAGPPRAEAPAAPKPAPKEADEPTQSVKPIAKPKARAGAPSNLMLTVLWILALLSVAVAVALSLFRL